MNADHYYAIGSTHIVCEDYARSGVTPEGKAYAIVCDGCSSSPDTDVGARIIGLEAEKYIRSYGEIPGGMLLATTALDRVKSLGLQPEAMDSTVIIALQKDDETVEIVGWGDGAVITRDGDEVITVSYEYDPNYPFYISYLADSNRMHAWRDSKIGLTISSTGPGGSVIRKENPSGEWRRRKMLLDGTLLLITTDGLFSFGDIDVKVDIPEGEISPRLTNIKTRSGKFVLRRTRRMLRNLKVVGIVHQDDLAVAGITR